MTKPENHSNCPLCDHMPESFCSDRKRDYLHCPRCDLIFVPENQRLTPAKEKARYDFHQNDPTDPGYRNFLNRLFQPLETKLSLGAHGLDFGCGPCPALSMMVKEAGYDCEVYDVFYANNPDVLDMQYDFITCSETMEHMYRPGEEFERFVRLIRPGGWIGIMTQLVDEASIFFDRWHYKDDLTHVCFFSKQTFRTLEKQYNLHLEFHSDSAILFQRLEEG